MTNQRMWKKLSAFSDDALTEHEKEEVTSGIASSGEVEKQFKLLQALKDTLRCLSSVPADPTFWPRLQQRIASKERGTARSPIRPVWSAPVATAAALIVVFVAAAVVWRTDVLQYFGRKSEQVQTAYEAGVRDWIMPLFEKTDKNNAFQFAMFGTLPVNEQTGTVLRLDNASAKGFRLEFVKPAPQPVPELTVEDLYREVAATDQQRAVIDTILTLAQRRLESSVLLSENQSLAISPELPRMHQELLANLVSTLEPDQRQRFVRLLDAHNTPYTFIARAVPPPAPSTLVQRFRTAPAQQAFVVLASDTTGLRNIEVNVDALREDMKRFTRAMKDVSQLFEFTARVIAEKQPTLTSREAISSRTDQRREIIRFELNTTEQALQRAEQTYARAVDEYQKAMQDMSVRVLPRKIYRELVRMQGVGPDIRMHIYDSGSSLELKLDSIIERAFEHIPDIEIELRGVEKELRVVAPSRRSTGKRDSIIFRR